MRGWLWCEVAAREGKGARQYPGEKREKAVWGIWEMAFRESETGCRGVPQLHRPLHTDTSPRGEKVVWRWSCVIAGITVTAAREKQQSSLLFHCPFVSSFLFLILGYCSSPDPWSRGHSTTNPCGSTTVRQCRSYRSFNDLKLRVSHEKQINKFWSVNSAEDFARRSLSRWEYKFGWRLLSGKSRD